VYFFLKIKFIVFSLFLTCNEVYGAEIEIIEKQYLDSIGILISIKGDIEIGDTKKLLKVLRHEVSNGNRLSSMPEEIVITSNGGSFEEALRMGKFIRASLIPVVAKNYCYSSCFIILMSSVEKSKDFSKNGTSIGIHRPYYEKKYFSNLSILEANKRYDALQEITKSFLMKMNVSISIIDKMFRTSSDKNYLLNNQELKQVLANTPAYEEWINSKCTKVTEAEQEDLFVIYLDFDGKEKLTKGYMDYLIDKDHKYTNCKKHNTFKVFKSVIKEWNI